MVTATKNEGRGDIRCLFGCRQENKRKRANKRSKDFYKSDIGKESKKKRNKQRSLIKDDPSRPSDEKSPKPSEVLKPSLFVKYIHCLLSWHWKDKQNIDQISLLVEFAFDYLRQRPLAEVVAFIVFTGDG
jgi:hypothetical protein